MRRGWRAAVVVVGAPSLVMAVLGALVAVRSPLWRDEIASLSFAELPLPDLFTAVTHVDGVMLPYYLVASLAQLLPPEWAIRVPSVVAMTVAVGATAALARRWWGPVAAVVAGFAIALNPLAIQQAATARPYALATCFVALAALALDAAAGRRDVPDGGRGRPVLAWAAYAACLALAGLMHLFAILAVPAFLVLALVARRLLAWALATAAGLVAVVPLMLFAYGQRGQVDWISRPTLRSGIGALASVLTFRSDSAFGPYEALALGLVTVAAVLALVLAWRRPSGGRVRDLGRVGCALAAFGGPWLVLFAVSLAWTPFLRTTYLTPALVGLGLLLGGAAGLGTSWALAGRRSWRLPVVAAIVAAPICASAVMAAAVVTRPWYVDDFPGLRRALGETLRTGDTLVVVQPHNEVGTASGVARASGDREWTAELQAQLVPGEQPRVGARRVDGVDPLRTTPLAAPPATGTVWVVYTRGAINAQDFGPVASGLLGCRGSTLTDVGAFGILRLADAGCVR